MSLPRKRPAYYVLSVSTVEQARNLGQMFLNRHRDLKPCRVNALRIIRYMQENNLPPSFENLDRAYRVLKADGKLRLNKTLGSENGGSKLLQM